MKDTSLKLTETQPSAQRYKSFLQIITLISTFSLGAFYFGFSMGYFSSIDFDTVMKIYGINWEKSTAQGLLTGCLPIGGGIGALSSNFLIQKFSRRYFPTQQFRQFIFIVNSLAFFAGFLIYIQNTYFLLLIRVIQGICVGCYSTITPVLIKEFSPTQIYGTLGAFNQVFISFGVFFSFGFKYLLQAIADDSKGEKIWWIVFGFTLITILLQTGLVLFVFPFQTPKYLLLNGRQNQALELLKKFYKAEFVNEVLQEKLLDIGALKSQSVISSENEATQSSDKDFMLPKQRKNNKVAIGMALHLAFLQQMVGVNAVVAYGGEIAGLAVPSLKSVFPVIINLQKFIGPLVVSYLLTKFGRKPIIVLGTLFGALATGCIAVGFFVRNQNEDAGNVMVLLGLVFFMANFGITLGPVIWLYIPEIVQPNVVPFSTGMNWSGTALVVLLFPIIKKELPDENPGYLFSFFSVWCVISFVINSKLMVETKGKSERQIYEQYGKIKLL